MATSNYLRRQRRAQIKVQTKYESLDFVARSKWARELIKEGKAKTQKEAWAIIKTL